VQEAVSGTVGPGVTVVNSPVITANDLEDMAYAYPTGASDIGSMI
jgi:hypothetical protein